MSFYEFFEQLSKPRVLREGFPHKGSDPFSIADARTNELFDKYFSKLPLTSKSFRFKVDSLDFDDIVYLLRVHFQLWIEIEADSITIYREFPQRFRLLEEVSAKNHWYTPKTLPKGTILYNGEDFYAVCNRSKGIPLSEIPPNKELNMNRPVVQINYDFIEVVDDLV